MTKEQLIEITRQAPESVVKLLAVKQIKLPEWAELEKQYDPEKHPIKTDFSAYPDPLTPEGRTIKLRRITVSDQRLYASRMAAMCAGLPVFRNYQTGDDKGLEDASKLLEAVYQDVNIDSVNLERLKALFASCEMATIWYSEPIPKIYNGVEYPNTIGCQIYSPMDGVKLYPQFDRQNRPIGLAIEYKRKNDEQKDVDCFDVYAPNGVFNYEKQDNWVEVSRGGEGLQVASFCYTYRPTPIWEDTSESTYLAEEIKTYMGIYIRLNSAPVMYTITDESTAEQILEALKKAKSDKAATRQLVLPTGSQVGYLEYQGATTAADFLTDLIRKDNDRSLQLFDFSAKSISGISTETLRLMLLDSQMKVKEEAGRFVKMFSQEEQVVKAHVSLMVDATMAKNIQSLAIKHEIIPFSVSDEMAELQRLSIAVQGGITSQQQAIKDYNGAEKAEQIYKEIGEETAVRQNTGEPNF